MSRRGSIWSVLEIEATNDVATIRRAYARKLKVTQPEDDPDGFQELRAAYERALAHAKHAASVDVRVERDGGEGERPDDAAAAQTVATDTAADSTAPAPAAEPAPPERDPELVELDEAYESLRQSLTAPSRPTAEVLIAQLRRVLQAPALGSLAVYQQAEYALAHLLAATQPNSDPLLVECIQHFRWDPDARLESTAIPVVNQLLARCRALEFEWNLRNGKHGLSHAYARLQTRSNGWWRWARTYSGVIDTSLERELLTTLRDHHPALLDSLDADEVDWWFRYIQRPRIPDATWKFACVVGVLCMFLTGSGRDPDLLHRFLGFVGGAVGVYALAYLKLVALDWPMYLLSQRHPRRRPAWMALGWAPASLLLVFLATALPLHPVVEWSAIVLGAACCLWSVLMVGPMPPLISHGMLFFRNSHIARALSIQALVLAIWAVGQGQVTEEFFDQRAFAILACILAFGFGHGLLVPYWDAQPRARRLLALGAACAVACAVAALAWFTQRTAAASACVLAAAVSTAVVTRVAHSDDPGFRTLTFVGQTLVLLAVIVFVIAGEGTTPAVVVTYGTLTLMAAVVLNLGAVCFTELRPRRRVV